jgi:hypothetical protein
MLQENIPLETIARITEFTIAQIQQLDAEDQCDRTPMIRRSHLF